MHMTQISPANISLLPVSPLTTSLLPVSPLTLSHQLLALAEQADGAGLSQTARTLLKLAERVCVERPRYLPM